MLGLRNRKLIHDLHETLTHTQELRNRELRIDRVKHFLSSVVGSRRAKVEAICQLQSVLAAPWAPRLLMGKVNVAEVAVLVNIAIAELETPFLQLYWNSKSAIFQSPKTKLAAELSQLILNQH